MDLWLLRNKDGCARRFNRSESNLEAGGSGLSCRKLSSKFLPETWNCIVAAMAKRTSSSRKTGKAKVKKIATKRKKRSSTSSGSTSAITGTVYAYDTGNPIPRATVKCGSQSTKAGTGGDYKLSGVPVGSRRVTASALKYLQETETVTVAAGCTASQDFNLANKKNPM
jgi:hypothetical protein